MSVKAYLLLAFLGGILVVVFSPSLFFLVVEGTLPKTPVERIFYEPVNFTIMNTRIYMSSEENLKNESVPINTIGQNYRLHGEIFANASLTFMLFNDPHEFQKYMNGSSSYSTIYRSSVEPGRKQQFSVELEPKRSFILEFVFIKTQEEACGIFMNLSNSYSVKREDVEYVPDLIRGMLFPSLCVVGLVLLVSSFIGFRRATKASYRPQETPTTIDMY